jgi:hypothetical protein
LASSAPTLSGLDGRPAGCFVIRDHLFDSKADVPERRATFRGKPFPGLSSHSLWM